MKPARKRYPTFIAALFALVLAALFSVQTLAQNSKSEVNSPRPAEPSIAREIPFELYHSRVFLQLRVNGSQPLWFVLDSGASVTVIDLERARSLGLKLGAEIEVEGLGAGEGKAKIASVKEISFSLANVTWPGRNVYATPLNYLAPYEGRAIDGILGYDFLSRYVVEVDYPHRTLSLYDPRGYIYAGRGTSIPFKLEGNWITVPVTIAVAGRAPIETTIQIDSGARGDLAFNRPFVEKHQLLTAVSKTFPGIRYGVGGEAPQLMCRIQSLQLGPFVIKNPITALSQAKKGATASSRGAGTISGNILRRFKVIFDYARKQMILEPSPDFSDPFEYDMSGVILKASGRDFKTPTIYRVFPNSPAEQAGLLEGDVIVSINGRPAGELTLEEIEQIFKREDQECRLVIKRGTETRQLKLKLKRLV
jgi:hypothetical protein